MESDKLWDALTWYVVQTHPRQEERAKSNLQAWGLESFTPQLKAQRFNPYSGRLSRQIKPLFPRYIFVRLKINDYYHKIRFTRGIHSFVCFNGGPCPVSDEIINIINSRIGEDGFVTIGEILKPGDQVLILDGPLKNFIGIFEQEINGSERVRILLDTVNFQAHLIVNRQRVTKIDALALPG